MSNETKAEAILSTIKKISDINNISPEDKNAAKERMSEGSEYKDLTLLELQQKVALLSNQTKEETLAKISNPVMREIVENNLEDRNYLIFWLDCYDKASKNTRHVICN
jgi:hypothetical protein